MGSFCIKNYVLLARPALQNPNTFVETESDKIVLFWCSFVE